MAQTHRLAAILFTDIVGYTAMMGQDEKKAFDVLKINREIHKAILEQYHGHWIKELGDGIMASFESANNAALAAMQIQKACRERGLFQLRIGIHLADVVFENDDVFGDGVNIAARIQAMAPIGGIWVSESVHQNLVNKQDIRSEFVKAVRLKNVPEPVRVYRILLEGDLPEAKSTVKGALITAVEGRLQWLSRRTFFFVILGLSVLTAFVYFKFGSFLKQSDSLASGQATDPSIAVLPFTDMSPDKDQEYLGDGLAEEIITVLSGINNLRVIGRTSSFQFKGEQMDLRDIGQKLNAGTILEGSVQKSGERIRITAQLIRARDHIHLWSERFDREMTDIFKIQDEIANHIAERLKLTLNLSGQLSPATQKTTPEAYTVYLKGLHAYNAQQYEESIEYNLEAIRIDSLFGAPYAYIALAKAWLINRKRDWQNKEALAEAREYAYQAIAKFPGLAEAYSALALMAWSIERDFPAAREFFEKSLLLNPNDALISNRYGYFLLWMADYDKAATLAARAMRYDPVDYNSYFILIRVYNATGRLEEAGRLIGEAKRLFPTMNGLDQFEATNLLLSGHFLQVIRFCDSILRVEGKLVPELMDQLSIAYYQSNRRTESNAILEQLKSEAAKGTENACYSVATVYSSRNEPDSAISWLNKSFERMERALRSLKIDPEFDSIRNHPGFQRIYREYGFGKYSN